MLRMASHREYDDGPPRWQIVNRTASDDFFAWQWANVAAHLGWRVVAVFPGVGGLCVWAEAPLENDPNDWDRAHRAAHPEEYDDEDDE